ncbi:hypothetical protein GCM10025762_29760 [Haloechinothrix salitolerans]
MACAVCEADYLRIRVPHVPVGRPMTGSQGVACVGWRTGPDLSVCANVAAAPELSVFAVAVTACPPLALLCSI